MASVDDLISVLRTVKGAPYLWYVDEYTTPSSGPPEYMSGGGWSADDVIGAGINCSGLFNWGLTQLGLDPVGGTPAYSDIASEEIDPNWEAIYSPGQFVITMSGEQGHMAMVSGYGDNLLIQADTYYNYVNEDRYLWNQQYYLNEEGMAFTWVGWIPGLDW